MLCLTDKPDLLYIQQRNHEEKRKPKDPSHENLETSHKPNPPLDLSNIIKELLELQSQLDDPIFKFKYGK